MPWTLSCRPEAVETTRESIEAWFKRGGLRGGRFEPDIERTDRRRRLCGDRQKGGRRPHLDQRGAGPLGIRRIEHVGLYPDSKVTGKAITQWYVDTFGFTGKEGASSFFVSSSGPGRIEIMKGPESDKPHIAVRVTNFELACSILKERGIELEEPKIKSDAKAVFLKGADPAGNKIQPLME